MGSRHVRITPCFSRAFAVFRSRPFFCRPELRPRRSRRRHMSHRRQFSIPAVRLSSPSRARFRFRHHSADPDPTCSERESTCAAPTRWSIRRAPCCTIPAGTGTPSVRLIRSTLIAPRPRPRFRPGGELRRVPSARKCGFGSLRRPESLGPGPRQRLSYGNHTSQKVAAGRSFSAVSSPFRTQFRLIACV
jgi:hypothetical protein